MTEQTRKELEEQATKLYGNLVYPKTHIELYVEGYIAGAEGYEKQEERIATLEGYERIVKDMQERGFNTYMSVKDFLQAHEELQERNKQLELIILGNQEEIAELQKNYNKQKEINHELVDDVAAMQARIEELKNQIRQIYQGEAQDLRSRFPC